jgi:RNA polymerase sigma-70 factor (ECF subfamily)
VNSALQRARATLQERNVSLASPAAEAGRLSDEEMQLLGRYVDAFHRYDVDELASLLREDAAFSMPPYTLWLQGPAAVSAWLAGRGAACRGSKLVPVNANGQPAFAQYKPGADGQPHQAWALAVLELQGNRIASWTSFLDTESLFPLFGLPLTLR